MFFVIYCPELDRDILTSGALNLLHLDDFSNTVTYTVMTTIFLWGKLGILGLEVGGGGELLPLKYPR